MAARDLAPLFRPRAIAVVGASDDATRLRGRILAQVVKGGFAGRVFPVNPRRSEVQGLPAFARVGDIPEPVDLALIAVPAETVPEVLEECVAAGVRSAMVFSGGFAEEGAAKRALQDGIGDLARRTGMVIAGPNSVGFLNVQDALAATFSPAIDFALLAEHRAREVRRRIGIVSQSGGLGFALFNRGLRRHLAFSHVVNTGNEADLDATDVLEFLIDDPATGVVLMFLESIRRGRAFMDAAARALALGKPIVVAKVGRSDAGIRAAASHTASLTGADAVYEAVFRRHGVTRADDQDEMLDVAAALALSPPAAGRRVGLVTISGGVGGWMADTLEAAGFTVPAFPPEVQARIREFLPPFGAAFNPVDITANAMENDHRARTLEVLAEAPGIDAMVNVSSLSADPRLPLERDRLAALAARGERPILFYSYPLPSAEAARTLAEIGIPLYTSLAGCARALAALAGLHEARARPVPGAPPPRDKAAAAAALDRAGERPTEWDGLALLAAYGIAAPEARLATNADAAVRHAEALGYPVALKVQSGDLPHKTEAGAVVLGLADASAVRAAHRRVLAAVAAAAPGAAIQGVLVERMAPPGVEAIVGAIDDPTFGPQVVVGLGGILVEAIGDRAMAPAPVGHDEARAMIASIAGARLFGAWRGRPPADVDALADIVVRVSWLAHDFAGRIREIDLNPVLVHSRGATAVDALVVPHPIQEQTR